MATGHRAHARALALACFALALFVSNTATARAQQAEPPRRPQGPAAGPIIKLPRGAGANEDESQQAASAKDAAARAAVQKWEYCAIVGFQTREKGLNTLYWVAIVRYFPGGSEEVEGSSEQEALINAFARLGDEGWELAGIKTEYTDSTGKTTATYFFKRPKRQE
jgi:hypothetical protein